MGLIAYHVCMKQYSDEIKEAAKILYLKKWKPKEIKQQLNLNGERIVYYWAAQYHWDDLMQGESVEQAISRRIILLAEKESKTEFDLKELNLLFNQLEKIAKIEKIKLQTKQIKEGKSEGAHNKKQSKNRKNNTKNDISSITPEALKKVREKLFFGYQQRWFANKNQRTRFILKSRQIGATYYFAWEAFEDAILSGDNQVFLSASRDQAEIFKAYIILFAKQYFDVELKGSPIILSNGAELRFISTNGRTAQGYHGHLYVDEVFWIPSFEKLNTLASGIAAHKKWRKTYFSTPSIKSHGAYPMWSGDKYNKDRKKKEVFDLSNQTLKEGLKGKDNIWRNVVTIKNAEQQGCDLFDIDELRLEYSKSEFNNLFMCAFMEAGASLFKLDDLLACAVDSNVIWVDFKKKQKQPFGNRPVWLGYDPARTGDRSTVVVLAPPIKPTEKFRVLEKIQLRGAYAHQANRIKDLLDKYNVQFIGIDCTGPGIGVYEHVKTFFKRATPITYSLETKTHLVLNAQDIIECHRIEWDAAQTEIPQAFMQITMETTGTGQITYAAGRNDKSGHADAAWAIMHALHNEPLNRRKRKARVSL